MTPIAAGTYLDGYLATYLAPIWARGTVQSKRALYCLCQSDSPGKKEVPSNEDFELFPCPTTPHRCHSVSGGRDECLVTAATNFGTACRCEFVFVPWRWAAVPRLGYAESGGLAGCDRTFSSAEVWRMQHVGLCGSYFVRAVPERKTLLRCCVR